MDRGVGRLGERRGRRDGGLDLRTGAAPRVAVGAVVAAWYVARRSPRLVVAGWAAVCFLVPIWVGVQAGHYWSALTGVTARRARRVVVRDITFSYVDILVVGFVVSVLAGYLVGGSTWGHVLIVLSGGSCRTSGDASCIARVDADWLYSYIAVAATGAAVLGISSSPAGPTRSAGSWIRTAYGGPGTNCSRSGGFVRAEGAFGHSIALAGAWR